MCTKKDIDAILDQFERCKDHEKKREILQQIDTCGICAHKQQGVAPDATPCGCEESHSVELFNLIEHLKQQGISKKTSDK